jgi:hypothetical protein
MAYGGRGRRRMLEKNKEEGAIFCMRGIVWGPYYYEQKTRGSEFHLTPCFYLW